MEESDRLVARTAAKTALETFSRPLRTESV
jgi:hypothetical protein